MWLIAEQKKSVDRWVGSLVVSLALIIIIIIMINLIYIAQFDTDGILTALYIVITYIQMQYVHV